MFLALKCLRKNKSSRNISFEIFHSHNTTCNWVNLLQVSSGQFMCCGQVFTGFTAYAELRMWTGKTFWCYAVNQKKRKVAFLLSTQSLSLRILRQNLSTLFRSNFYKLDRSVSIILNTDLFSCICFKIIRILCGLEVK